MGSKSAEALIGVLSGLAAAKRRTVRAQKGPRSLKPFQNNQGRCIDALLVGSESAEALIGLLSGLAAHGAHFGLGRRLLCSMIFVVEDTLEHLAFQQGLALLSDRSTCYMQKTFLLGITLLQSVCPTARVLPSVLGLLRLLWRAADRMYHPPAQQRHLQHV